MIRCGAVLLLCACPGFAFGQIAGGIGAEEATVRPLYELATPPSDDQYMAGGAPQRRIGGGDGEEFGETEDGEKVPEVDHPTPVGDIPAGWLLIGGLAYALWVGGGTKKRSPNT